MKIRNIAAGCALLLAISPALAGDDKGAEFESGEPFASITLGYDTDYVFRGQDYGDSLISTGIDLSPITISDGVDLSLGAWHANTYDSDFTELDLYAAAGLNLGGVDTQVGVTYYTFGDGSDPDAVEPFISVSTDLMGVPVSLGYAYDTEQDGGWISLATGRSIELSDSFTLQASASLNYATDYAGVDGLNNLDLRLGLPMALGSATVTPYIAGSIAIDDGEASGLDDEVYGGVSLSVSF